MIERSFDLEKLLAGLAMVPKAHNEGADYVGWLKNFNNFMFVEGDNVGLAAWEYPGVYTVHWFFTERGRKALALAKNMLHELFQQSDATTLRGLTPIDNKAARWLAKQIGFKSYGTVPCKYAECELILMSKDDFYKGYK